MHQQWRRHHKIKLSGQDSMCEKKAMNAKLLLQHLKESSGWFHQSIYMYLEKLFFNVPFLNEIDTHWLFVNDKNVKTATTRAMKHHYADQVRIHICASTIYDYADKEHKLEESKVDVPNSITLITDSDVGFDNDIDTIDNAIAMDDFTSNEKTITTTKAIVPVADVQSVPCENNCSIVADGQHTPNQKSSSPNLSTNETVPNTTTIASDSSVTGNRIPKKKSISPNDQQSTFRKEGHSLPSEIDGRSNVAGGQDTQENQKLSSSSTQPITSVMKASSKRIIEPNYQFTPFPNKQHSKKPLYDPWKTMSRYGPPTEPYNHYNNDQFNRRHDDHYRHRNQPSIHNQSTSNNNRCYQDNKHISSNQYRNNPPKKNTLNFQPKNSKSLPTVSAGTNDINNETNSRAIDNKKSPSIRLDNEIQNRAEFQVSKKQKCGYVVPKGTFVYKTIVEKPAAYMA
jgi:hypothetical protein